MIARHTSQRWLIAVLAILLAAIGVVLVAASQRSGGAGAVSQPSSPFAGPSFPPGLHAPPFSLADQNGRPVSLSQYRGHIVLLTFIHSKCADTCPLLAEDMKGALDLLPANGRGIDAVAITAAPAEDSAASRRAFITKHHLWGRLEFLNGPIADLRRIWRSYHVNPVVSGQPDHTAFVILIDKAGVERVGDPADQATPESLAHDIGALARS
jgi:protein SCO1/2